MGAQPPLRMVEYCWKTAWTLSKNLIGRAFVPFTDLIKGLSSLYDFILVMPLNQILLHSIEISMILYFCEQYMKNKIILFHQGFKLEKERKETYNVIDCYYFIC